MTAAPATPFSPVLDRSTDGTVRPRRVAALAVAIAVTSYAGTIVGSSFVDDPAAYETGPAAVFAQLGDHLPTQVGAGLLYAAAFLTFLLRPRLVAWLGSRTPDAGRPLVDRIGASLDVAVATLVIGAVFKSILASGLPGGIDEALYTQVDVAVTHTIVGQLQFGVFMPFIATTGLFATLVLRHRALPRWAGAVAALMALAVCTVTLAFNLPWASGLIAPLWLLMVAALALTVGSRSR